MPFALKPAVEEDLQKLEALGICEPVSHSNYATPVVPVMKKDETICLFGDYKKTVNPCLEVERHPLPKTEEILGVVAGATVFSNIDLSHANQQAKMHPYSQSFLTIIIHP